MSPVIVAILVLLLLVVGFVVVRRRRPRSLPDAAVAPPPAGPHAPVSDGLGARIRALFAGKRATEDEWRRLEDLLVRADVGPRAAAEVVARVRERYTPESDPSELLAREMRERLAGDTQLRLSDGELSVVMVVGVNGAGKTTTIGKLARMLVREGRSVGLANSDTFRAAAAEQLGVWADRAGATLVAQTRGADPGAVAFDAVQSARSRGTDVLIVDTAGRLHTRRPLMEELEKVKRVLEKAAGDVEEVLLVIDATTGQNGIQQARVFTEAVDVTGIALTKLDGTAKGGVVIAVRDELGLPVKLVGTGEGPEDLERFEPGRFAEALLAS